MSAIALPKALESCLSTARELIAPPLTGAELQQRLPTAIDPMDRILQGGLVRGELVELVGRHSSGRYSTVLATLATTTQIGEAVAARLQRKTMSGERALVTAGGTSEPIDAVRSISNRYRPARSISSELKKPSSTENCA